MKCRVRIALIILVLAVMAVSVTGCYSSRSVDQARREGHSEGYEEGYQEGYEQGYEEGYEQGVYESEVWYEEEGQYENW